MGQVGEDPDPGEPPRDGCFCERQKQPGLHRRTTFPGASPRFTVGEGLWSCRVESQCTQETCPSSQTGVPGPETKLHPNPLRSRVPFFCGPVRRDPCGRGGDESLWEEFTGKPFERNWGRVGVIRLLSGSSLLVSVLGRNLSPLLSKGL